MPKILHASGFKYVHQMMQQWTVGRVRLQRLEKVKDDRNPHPPIMLGRRTGLY